MDQPPIRNSRSSYDAYSHLRAAPYLLQLAAQGVLARAYIYAIRLVAFLLIIAGIIDTYRSA